METAFSIFFQLGYDHILDIQGIDHLLFIVALCATYRLREWKKVAILATAFTIGHSITLAMAVGGVITFPARVIEFLVPMTILLTTLYNLFFFKEKSNSYKYGLALFFGLIHGMAFSNFFKSTQIPGQESQLWKQLLAFNLGVEVGQLLIVGGVLLITYVMLNILKVKQLSWTRGVSLFIIIMVIYLFYQLLN